MTDANTSIFHELFSDTSFVDRYESEPETQWM